MIFREEEPESCAWAKRLWRQIKLSTFVLTSMLVAKIILLFASSVATPIWDLGSDYIAAYKHIK